MKIQVTAEDIKNGCRKDSNCCPIALAVNRAFEKQEGVESHVGALFVGLRGPNDIQGTFDLPPFVAEFLEDYDSGTHDIKEFEPFDFSIPEKFIPKLKKNGFQIG